MNLNSKLKFETKNAVYAKITYSNSIHCMAGLGIQFSRDTGIITAAEYPYIQRQ